MMREELMDRNVETDVELSFAQKGFALARSVTVSPSRLQRLGKIPHCALIIPYSFSKHVDVFFFYEQKTICSSQSCGMVSGKQIVGDSSRCGTTTSELKLSGTLTDRLRSQCKQRE
jgi:hypothetical protein